MKILFASCVCMSHLSLSVWDCSCMPSAFLTFISGAGSCFLLCPHCVCVVLPWSCLSACSTAAALSIKSVTPSLFSFESAVYIPHEDFPFRSMLKCSSLCFIMRVQYAFSLWCSAFSIQIETFSCKIITVPLHTRKTG